MKTRLYISGKITGEKNYYAKFHEAAVTLEKAGYEPLNPAQDVATTGNWNEMMREALTLMLACDGVALLPDWQNSKGALIEAGLARSVGIPARPLDAWLEAR